MVKKILVGFGVLAIILTLLPLVLASLDYWWIRVFDFPHLQLTFLTSLAIVAYFIKFNFKDIKEYTFMAILVACCVFQFIKIFPYTSFASLEILNATESSNHLIKILTANVYQNNKKSDLIIKEIEKLNPDLLLLTEVNKRWIKDLEETVNKLYSFKHEFPLNNTYGMALYSKKRLLDSKTNFLVSDSIPSIETKILIDKDTIQLFAIHPTPPMPKENPMSTNRDTEMMFTAKMSLDSKFPVIVLGDFNDVAWSQTSKLFKSVSELLDARIGRGLFNTYSAKSYLMKWPLDHIFVSEDFRVKKLEVRPDINSDHFPLLTVFSYEPEKAEIQKPKKVTKEDLEQAKNQIKNFNKKDPRK